MQTVTDQTQPTGKWQFDENVTAVFDDMLSRSIPQYDVMRRAVTDLAVQFAKRGTDILDLGCSRGEAIAPLIDALGTANHFVGVEVSDPMLTAAAERFKGYINCHVVSLKKCDLRESFPICRASVILSILTLQFTPIEHRQRIVQNVYNHLQPGGAFILVEKVLGSNAAIDALMVDTYYHLKKENGYTQDAIDRKRLSLEGVLVPITARWNEDLLHSAGFDYVDCFWRWMNFAGWIAIKPEAK